jgi:tRNA A-37 threonylcarbamoyl transferase component Bud32
MTTVFHRIGRYEIHDQIGRGGMAVVFLATDTETNQRVALKLVSIEADRDGQQVLEAERWGATLQEEFCRESRYVPAVYAHGTHGQYFFIAMEYLEGRNLSEVIGEGPLPPARAVHIASQICEFLQAAETFDRTLDGRTFNLLLHGDLKPRNIRVLAGDEIKVFDFGIAKALSLSRKVTRNDFGSIAYLSPERLESGEIDAQAELWAVGVLLYEMMSGVQPFRAADTRRLEQRIRARQPPAALDSACPAGLQAIVAKLLAPAVTDRYANATAIRDDLHRFEAGELVLAEREGWPDRGHDEAVTRRTHRAPVDPDQGDADVTRRTVRDTPAAPAAAMPSPTAIAAPALAAPGPPAATAAVATAAAAMTMAAGNPARRFRRLRWLARKALMAIAILMVLNEIRIYFIAGALAQNVPQEITGVIQMWNQQRRLSEGSLHLGVAPLERALVTQGSVLYERTFARYRAASATVFEREWRQTRDALQFTVGTDSSSRHRAALRYCEGHLRRIDGEARLKAKQAAAAQPQLTAAVALFREAAELRADWADPFLGLMRTFIAMDDVERGADALAQAERFGYAAGNRDWVLLGEGYLTRAAKLAESDDLELLTRAAEAYTKAIDHLSKATNAGNTAQRLREAQRRLKEVQERIEHLPLFVQQEQTA